VVIQRHQHRIALDMLLGVAAANGLGGHAGTRERLLIGLRAVFESRSASGFDEPLFPLLRQQRRLPEQSRAAFSVPSGE
jgi:hypothetical protein